MSESFGGGGASSFGGDDTAGGFGNKSTFETTTSYTIESDAKKDIDAGADNGETTKSSKIDAFMKEVESATLTVCFFSPFLVFILDFCAQSANGNDKDIASVEGGIKENEVESQVSMESKLAVNGAEKSAQESVWHFLRPSGCRHSTNGRKQR